MKLERSTSGSPNAAAPCDMVIGFTLGNRVIYLHHAAPLHMGKCSWICCMQALAVCPVQTECSCRHISALRPTFYST